MTFAEAMDLAQRTADADALRRLALHPALEVRLAVAQNPNLPGDLIQACVRDPHPLVRGAYAVNMAAPQAVLKALARDKHLEVRLSATRTLAAMYGLT